MSVPFRIGVLQLSMEPLEETVGMAKACEAAGFDAFWLAEAYPWWRKHSMEARSSTAVTAILARETRHIPIGWGIISPYTRHPVQIAMEARVLQEAAGEGRFRWYPANCGFSGLCGNALRFAKMKSDPGLKMLLT